MCRDKIAHYRTKRLLITSAALTFHRTFVLMAHRTKLKLKENVKNRESSFVINFSTVIMCIVYNHHNYYALTLLRNFIPKLPHKLCAINHKLYVCITALPFHTILKFGGKFSNLNIFRQKDHSNLMVCILKLNRNWPLLMTSNIILYIARCIIS